MAHAAKMYVPDETGYADRYALAHIEISNVHCPIGP
jgi:hypothetical protein